MKEKFKISQISVVNRVFIILNMLTLYPWLLLAIFATTFVFNTEKFTNEIIPILIVLAIWTYPILVGIFSFWGIKYEIKNGKKRFSTIIISIPTIFSFLFIISFIIIMTVIGDIIEPL